MLHSLNFTIFVIGLILLATGLVSAKFLTSYFSQPLVSILFGMLLGPYILNLVPINEWTNKYLLLEEASRFTLAMSLMAAVLKLPLPFLSKNIKPLLIFILIGVCLMSLISGFIVHIVFSLPLLTSLMIGAIIAPTDPVLASTIISGPIATKYLPERIRYSLSVESAANDGIALPFIMLPFVFSYGNGSFMREWVAGIVLWETAGAVVIGATTGIFVGWLFNRSAKRKLIRNSALRAIPFSLAFILLAGLKLINCNGIIGVFAGGLAFNFMLPENKDKTDLIEPQEVAERLFMIPVFVLFGIAFPWKEMVQQGFLILIFTFLILIFRRLPVIFLIKPYIKTLKTNADFWLCGWFGPIGIGALYYSTYILRQTHESYFWTLPSAMILASAIVHGFSAYPFVKLYFKHR